MLTHVWGALSVFVMMLLGAGMWFADAGRPAEAGSAARRPEGPADVPAAAAASPSRAIPYSRGRAALPDDPDAAEERAPRMPYSRPRSGAPGGTGNAERGAPPPHSRKPPR